MKKAFTLVFLVAATASASAQGPERTPAPTFDEAVNAFALKPPDEGSPFFADRELARREREGAATAELTSNTGVGDTAIYPRTRGAEVSAGQTFTRFFTDMFSSVRLNLLRPRKGTQNRLTLEPESFALSDRREIEVIYSVRNDGRRMMRLDFPTTQRIEILTRDENWNVVDRWSDDRAFDEREGIIFINPGEKISYKEKIPTREMKAYEQYTVTGEIVGYEDYGAGRQVTPSP